MILKLKEKKESIWLKYFQTDFQFICLIIHANKVKILKTFYKLSKLEPSKKISFKTYQSFREITSMYRILCRCLFTFAFLLKSF